MSSPYVLVLYYSKTGSVATLAQHVKRGVESVQGIEARIRTVPEVSETTKAVDKPVPDIGAPYVTLEDLQHCSGLVLGSPTRFGNMAAPIKHFIDNTTSLWFSGALIDKPAAVFTSTSSMHGGQETTLTSMMLPLIHQGMIMVGIPYSIPELSTTTSGGTPYGASHVAGPENKNPHSDDELLLAKKLGERVAHIALKMKSE